MSGPEVLTVRGVMRRCISRPRNITSQTIRYFFSYLSGGLNEKERVGLVFAIRLIFKHRLSAVLVVVFGLGAAIFEGSSMGILALAVSIFLGEGTLEINQLGGKIGGVVDSILATLTLGEIFLLFVVLAVALQVVKSAMIYGSQTAQVYLNIGMRRDSQKIVTDRIMSLTYPEISRYASGSVAGVIDQAQSVQGLVDMLSNVTRSIFMLGAYFAVLLWMSIPMTIAALIVMSALWIALTWLARIIKKLSRQAANAKIFVWRWTIEFLNAPKLLRIFNSTGYAANLINNSREDVLVPERKSAVIEAAIKPAMEIVTIVGAGILLIAGFFIAGEEAKAAIPKLFVFVIIFQRLKTPIQSVSDVRAKMAKILPQFEIIAEFVRESAVDKPIIKDEGAIRFKNNVVFSNVYFRYPDTSKYVLEGIDLSIPRGKTIALVGASGAGKTSIVDLMIGLFQPTSGVISVDGKNLNEINIGSWREIIGVVEQDVFLLNASIADNIRFARRNATMEDIRKAARMSHAYEFIDQLPDGYETIIGDRGYGLSGGQQQRVSLARALLCNPDVLILDEATSALDTESERLIQVALEEMHNDRTILVIAHRLSTVVNADNIIVLEGGRIIEEGSQEELVKRAGQFAKLWNLQGI